MRVGSFQNDNPYFQYRPNTSSLFPILNIHVRILFLCSLRQIQTKLVIVGFIPPFASPTRRHFPNHPILPEPSNTPPSPTAVGEGRGEGRFFSKRQPAFPISPKHLIRFPHPVHPEHPCENSYPAFLAANPNRIGDRRFHSSVRQPHAAALSKSPNPSRTVQHSSLSHGSGRGAG